MVLASTEVELLARLTLAIGMHIGIGLVAVALDNLLPTIVESLVWVIIGVYRGAVDDAPIRPGWRKWPRMLLSLIEVLVISGVSHHLSLALGINQLYTFYTTCIARDTYIALAKRAHQFCEYRVNRLLLDGPSEHRFPHFDDLVVLLFSSVGHLSTLLILSGARDVRAYLVRNMWDVDVPSLAIITACISYAIVFLIPFIVGEEYDEQFMNRGLAREEEKAPPTHYRTEPRWLLPLVDGTRVVWKSLVRGQTWYNLWKPLSLSILRNRIGRLFIMTRRFDLKVRKLGLWLTRQARDWTRTAVGGIHRNLISYENLPAYQYDPLPSRCIRLLRLPRRGILSGLLDLKLVAVKMEKSKSTYEALSYTWGPPNPRHPILLNGKRYTVGPSLYGLLHARSSLLRDRLVWVDALCIDQTAENTEKAEQLSLMGDIYANADRVIAWLGDPYNALLATEMMELILDLDSRLPRDQFRDLLHRRASIMDWKGFVRLTLENPYFSRAWIFQEMALGHSLQFYIAGKYYRPDQIQFAFVKAFARGTQSLLNAGDSGGLGIKDLTNMRSLDNLMCSLGVRDRIDGDSNAIFFSLARLLFTTAKYQTTVEADKVYAILGIAGVGDRPIAEFIIPDYRKTPAVVFEETATTILQAWDATDSLQFILAFAGVGLGGRAEGMPSWVPDWSAESKAERAVIAVFTGRDGRSEVPAGYASYGVAGLHRTSQLRVRVDAKAKSLALKAMAVDEITFMTAPLASDDWRGSAGQDVYPWLRAVRRVYEDHVGYKGSHDDTLWRTLIANRTDFQAIPTEDWALKFMAMESYMHMAHTRYHNALVDLTAADFEQRSKEHQAETMQLLKAQRFFILLGEESGGLEIYARGSALFSQRMQEVCVSRRVAVTKGGLLAVVPTHSRVGDVVFFIPGLATLFIMRKKDDGTSAGVQDPEDGKARLKEQMRYQLVGETYVHGLMEGEKKWPKESLHTVHIV